MRSTKTLKHLSGVEGFVNWSEGFAANRKWKFADKALRIGIHNLMANNYGKGWTKSSEYAALKSRIAEIYDKILASNHVSIPWRIFMWTYLHFEPAARLFYRVKSRK